MLSATDRRILDVLAAERHWLSFDELYSKDQCDSDWTDFALQLEQLVKQGDVQYALLHGMDSGYYRIKGGYENSE